MSRRSRTLRRCLLLAVVLAIGGAAVVVWRVRQQPEPPVEPPRDPFPAPGYTATPYLNTAPTAHYVGSDACARCHRARHESYLRTTHSRALAELDPAAEPPDGTFEHPRSGRTFRVYREGGRLRHEEVLRTAQGSEMARIDVPVRYVIGSGQFVRSYLVELDGFLHESPITWYSARKRWDMSPGYDAPAHWGFERPAEGGCILCHAGRFDTGGTLHHVTFREQAIGCESCHGPGSLHQERHASTTHEPGSQDFTIVNPARLSRPLQEAVCALCHLNGPAAVRRRGRQLDDYRPGMPLTDYRIDYRFAADSETMTVVGHFEQLRRSACYQKSPQLSCLTCHDLHARQRPADPIAYYRQKCLDCHSDLACRLEPAERKKRNAADNCVACHMPRGDTEIPHIAFTHHRIGRHAPTGHTAPDALVHVPDLAPVEDIDHLEAWEKQRGLGLAYLQVSVDPMHAEYAEVYRRRAREQLEAVRAAGLREGDVAAALAETYWGQDSEGVHLYAKEAIEAGDTSPKARVRALFMLASTDMQAGYYATAAARFEELVRLRRFADDWRLLGLCYAQQDQLPRARSALEQALAIRPYRHTTHQALADIYRRQGDAQRASEHQAKARWLVEHRQD
jgi:tetratricopeptide (TPR) repeat protein